MKKLAPAAPSPDRDARPLADDHESAAPQTFDIEEAMTRIERPIESRPLARGGVHDSHELELPTSPRKSSSAPISVMLSKASPES